MLQEWKQVDQELIGDYRIFQLEKVRRVSPRTDRTHTFVRMAAPDWINIVALTPDEQLVMVRQYRHGNNQIELEIPGGMVDPGEDALVAAKRELLEETGYSAESIIKIGSVTPNPAIMDNLCHTYLALNCTHTHDLDLDNGEDIEVTLVPLSQFGPMVATGDITHALTIAALFHYNQYRATQ